ncbi:hypothetical protein GMA8713_03269 [Grimontia marina]|uniref:Uncharacterized protein n=1 Tax=Grimontia marina TaxID=646534 RepID=A0A128FET4_9GAMM|nr:hypothetical protein GMA8713_03269 [Grimontia marina]
MIARRLTPYQFVQEFYPGLGLQESLVVKWIKQGKLKGGKMRLGVYYVYID